MRVCVSCGRPTLPSDLANQDSVLLFLPWAASCSLAGDDTAPPSGWCTTLVSLRCLCHRLWASSRTALMLRVCVKRRFVMCGQSLSCIEGPGVTVRRKDVFRSKSGVADVCLVTLMSQVTPHDPPRTTTVVYWQAGERARRIRKEEEEECCNLKCSYLMSQFCLRTLVTAITNL